MSHSKFLEIAIQGIILLQINLQLVETHLQSNVWMCASFAMCACFKMCAGFGSSFGS
jgi:hypothetical protein